MITTIEQALAALGVTDQTLTPEEQRSLDELGYVIFPDAIPPDRLRTLQSAYDTHPTSFSLTPGDGQNAEEGGGRHTNMEHMAPAFDYAYTHPKHLAAVYRIFKCRFGLFTINGRDPKLGKGHQILHRDAGRTPDRKPICCQSLWMLDDFGPDNGPTRIVPRTHRQDDAGWRELPPVDKRGEPHPDQVLVQGKAGSIVVFDSTLMHGGTLNRSGQRRRTLHSTFCTHYFTNQFPHQKWITPEMYDRISPAARFLLRVTERPTFAPVRDTKTVAASVTSSY
jgi:ectoine hydroxylase-related dioxygenase (phytanoyl-CoA dioxygenase family)